MSFNITCSFGWKCRFINLDLLHLFRRLIMQNFLRNQQLWLMFIIPITTLIPHKSKFPQFLLTFILFPKLLLSLSLLPNDICSNEFKFTGEIFAMLCNLVLSDGRLVCYTGFVFEFLAYWGFGAAESCAHDQELLGIFDVDISFLVIAEGGYSFWAFKKHFWEI